MNIWDSDVQLFMTRDKYAVTFAIVDGRLYRVVPSRDRDVPVEELTADDDEVLLKMAIAP